MNKRSYLRFQGWSFAIAVIVLILIFSFQKIDNFGIIFGIAFLSFLSYRSYSCFKELKVTSESERVFAPSIDSTTTEKISFYKRMLLLGIPAFIILSIWIYFDLSKLENGTVQSVSLWEPISMLYNLGGYWPAVLGTPLLGLLTVALLIKKLIELKNIEKQ